MMQRAGLVLAVLIMMGCGDSSESTQSCTPGASLACQCTDGAPGAQLCNAEGTGLEPCICDPNTPDVINPPDTSCPTNFTGPKCDQCANAWTGDNCDVCPDNWAGDNCDVCANSWTGEECELCPEKWTGAKCDVCAENPLLAYPDCSQTKVDFLWVLDNSVSMGHEQESVASSVSNFLETIEKDDTIDYRLAVITTDVKNSDHMGKFRHHRTDQFPWACREEQVRLCLTGEAGDVECQSKYGRCSDGSLCEIDASTLQGDCANGSACVANGQGWICDSGNFNFKDIQNCNGSINSSCERSCESDAECEQEFTLDDPSTPDVNESIQATTKCEQDPSSCRYMCLNIAQMSACILRPSSASCPSDDEMREQLLDDNGTGTPFLTQKNASTLLKCIAIVGAEQTHTARNEEAFNAALLALDKEGPNAEQAKTFLRDNAYLAIIFVSDEDDGSAAEGLSISFQEAITPCKYLKPVGDGEGKLSTVSDAANALKSLKTDPAHILVASIVGDSVAQDPQKVAVDRALYKDSKCGGETCPDYKSTGQQSTICTAPGVSAEYGERYISLTEQFGDNGLVANICSTDGMPVALETIANRVLKIVDDQSTQPTP